MNLNLCYIILLTLIKTTFSQSSSHNLKPLQPSPFNTIDLIEVDNDLHAIQLSIGYPPQKFTLLFDINSENTWVKGSRSTGLNYGKVFNESESQTLIKTNTSKTWSDNSQMIKGEIVYDYLSIKIFSASNMPFLIVNEDYYIEGVDGVIGFGFGRDSEVNYSILDKLKENNQIKERVFTLNFGEEETLSSIHLGKLPPHISNDLTNLTMCNINTTLSNWNCKISHLFIGSEINFYKSIPVNVNAVFSTTVDDIILPIKYLQFFNQIFFEKYPNYDSKFCFVKPDGKKNYILCNNKQFDISKAPMLSFIINGYAYRIPSQNLFEQLFSDAYNQFYFFKIVFMDTSDPSWILGINFLQQFEVVFNKDSQQIGFYGGEKFDLTKFTRDRHETLCFYNYFIFAFLFCLILFSMGYIIYKKKQEQKILYFEMSYSDTLNNKKNTIKEKEFIPKTVNFKK